MTFNSRLSVGEGLDHLAARLDPIIASRLAGVLGGLPWTEVLVQLDFVAGRPPRQYSRTDLQTQLKNFESGYLQGKIETPKVRVFLDFLADNLTL